MFYITGKAGFKPLPGVFDEVIFMEQNQDLDDLLNSGSKDIDYLMLENEVSSVVCLGED